MKPSNTVSPKVGSPSAGRAPQKWGRVLACCLAVGGTLGLWAGGAVAQTDDGWFDDSAPAEPPPAEAAPGAPDYSPPPPDFQPARPEAPPPESAAASEAQNDVQAQQRAVEEFSPRLEPYGRWLDDPRYGRIWVPSRSVVGTEFVPYSTGGHWELTPDDAWLWASDYPFGGITFHYGRWVWASGGSWGWVPGYVYAPAWVDFHVGAAGYIGWAPLGPSYVWRHGMFLSVGLWRPAPVIYVPTQYAFVRTMPRYVIRDRVRVRSISAQSHVYRPRYAGRSGPGYLARGPSPREARIPARALPSRRVLAQPRLSPLSGASQRTRFESSRAPASRGSSYRSRSYDAYRPPARPQRWSNEDRRSTVPRTGWSAPANRAGDRRAAPEAYHPRPTRTGPAVAPRDRSGRPAYSSDRAAVAPRDRSAYRAPYASDRAAVAPRATRPEAADARGSRRSQRRSDDSSNGDSRARGRERSGSWR
ncbi:MAG: DUF6600 domain-containing protein [Deltaproteobacteria bacterium]